MSEKLSEKLYKAKVEWAKADKLSNYLEEMRKPMLASEVIKARKGGEKTMNMCEHIGYDSKEYRRHIKRICKAKEQTNIQFAYFQKVMQEIEEEKQKNMSNNMALKYLDGKGN